MFNTPPFNAYRWASSFSRPYFAAMITHSGRSIRLSKDKSGRSGSGMAGLFNEDECALANLLRRFELSFTQKIEIEDLQRMYAAERELKIISLITSTTVIGEFEKFIDKTETSINGSGEQLSAEEIFLTVNALCMELMKDGALTERILQSSQESLGRAPVLLSQVPAASSSDTKPGVIIEDITDKTILDTVVDTVKSIFIKIKEWVASRFPGLASVAESTTVTFEGVVSGALFMIAAFVVSSVFKSYLRTPALQEEFTNKVADSVRSILGVGVGASGTVMSGLSSSVHSVAPRPGASVSGMPIAESVLHPNIDYKLDY